MDSWGAKHRTIGQKERLKMCYCNQDRNFFRSFRDLSKQGTIFIRLQKDSNLSNKGLFVHSAPEKSRRIVAHSNLLGASFWMPMHSASSQRWGTYTFPSGSRPRWSTEHVLLDFQALPKHTDGHRDHLWVLRETHWARPSLASSSQGLIASAAFIRYAIDDFWLVPGYTLVIQDMAIENGHV